MTIDFKVGTRLLLKDFHAFGIGEWEVTIVGFDDSYILIYSEKADAIRMGHRAYKREVKNWEELGLPEPIGNYGSWFTSVENIRTYIIKELPPFIREPLSPNWKVIRKIKEIAELRKKLGYKYV